MNRTVTYQSHSSKESQHELHRYRPLSTHNDMPEVAPLHARKTRGLVQTVKAEGCKNAVSHTTTTTKQNRIL